MTETFGFAAITATKTIQKMMPITIDTKPRTIAQMASPRPRSPVFLIWLRPMKPRMIEIRLKPKKTMMKAMMDRTFHFSAGAGAGDG